jgi:hypothetical protein
MCETYFASEEFLVSMVFPSGRLRNANVVAENIWGQSVNYSRSFLGMSDCSYKQRDKQGIRGRHTEILGRTDPRFYQRMSRETELDDVGHVLRIFTLTRVEKTLEAVPVSRFEVSIIVCNKGGVLLGC